jgi:hypothetical protein
MNKTFIWGHRGTGLMGMQNTISSFQNAIDMGVDGIKTEAKISKDKEIFLTFEQSLNINDKYVPINELKSYEIKEFKLENGKSIPTLRELFSEFKDYKIRYNFDINAPEIGIRIIEIAKEFKMVEKIEIAKPSIYPKPLPKIFSMIRKFDKDVKLVNSIFLKYPNINENHLELDSMRDLDIKAINVNYLYANFELFKKILDNRFEFYIWGVIFDRNMKKFLKMNYRGRYIDAMMSNFPIKLLNLRNKIQVN